MKDGVLLNIDLEVVQNVKCKIWLQTNLIRLCGSSSQSDSILPSKIVLFIQSLFCFRPKYFAHRFGSLLPSYLDPNLYYTILMF